MLKERFVDKEKARKEKRRQNFLSFYQGLGIPFYLVLVFLILLPMLLIIIYAVTEPQEALPISRITFKWFKDFFTKDKEFLKVLLDSLKYAFYATFFALIIGYPAAYFITKLSQKGQVIIILLITVPMWINMLLRIFAWRQILMESGPLHFIFNLVGIKLPKLLGTDFAITLGMVYVFLPFMILPIYTILNKIDHKLLEASEDLGASKKETFLRVILPLSIPGILTGVTMVFLPAATTLVVPQYLGEGKKLIGNIIEARFIGSTDWNSGSAIAIILTLVILILITLTKKFDRFKE